MSQPKQFVIGCVIGTRPELIKMAPIIFKLRDCSWAKIVLVNTAQHRSLLDDMLYIFGLIPDIDLNCMTPNQSLGELTANLCSKLDDLVSKQHFDALLAVGDTTTVFVTSLIAFYHRISFGHIEAGLRTNNVQEPFPEEINRVLTAPLATWHFAPTQIEQAHLIRENINPAKIIVSGNPVIDALYWVLKNRPQQGTYQNLTNFIMVTAHRRENFGPNMRNICEAIIELAERFQHLHFLLPVHPNPLVQKDILYLLAKQPRIHLLTPIPYDEFAYLMSHSLLVMTDSGGVQEEAPALKKPVVVLRNTTERPAIIIEGVGILVGTEKTNIVAQITRILNEPELYAKMARGVSPYGDGQAASRIVACLENYFLAQ